VYVSDTKLPLNDLQGNCRDLYCPGQLSELGGQDKFLVESGQLWMQYSCLSDVALSTCEINKSNCSEVHLFQIRLVVLETECWF